MPEIKNLYEVIGAIVIVTLLVIGKYLILPWLKDLFFKKKDPVVASIVLDQKVIQRLEFIMKTTNSDRVRIFRFHNGGHYYPNGRSMQKMSCQYEVVNDGIAGNINALQNLLISPFNNLLTELLNNKKHIIENAFQILDEQLKIFYKSMGIKHVYNCALFSIDNKFMGILALEFVKGDPNITEDIESFIDDNAILLSGYLEE